MKPLQRNEDPSAKTMADHLGIEERRKDDRRKIISPWLGTDRRKTQRRQNPHIYRDKSGK